jgi:hypothetical protein
VKLADNNNAPRQKITIEKPRPATFSGDIELDCKSDKIEIWDADVNGTKVALPKKFPAAALPKDLWVQGVKESDSMRDVTITISAAGKELSSVRFTVLWVEKPDVTWSGTLSPKNAKRNGYKDWTAGKNFDLKFQRYTAIHGSRWGFGTEASGKVHPPNFKYPGSHLMLARDVEQARFHNRVRVAYVPFNTTIPPGKDTGGGFARDDLPPTLFDWDAPGVGIKTQPSGYIDRRRDNFKAFASVHVQGQDVRCSEITSYFVVLSMKQTAAPTGHTWVQINDVPGGGDNKVAAGVSNTTWDLK